VSARQHDNSDWNDVCAFGCLVPRRAISPAITSSRIRRRTPTSLRIDRPPLSGRCGAAGHGFDRSTRGERGSVMVVLTTLCRPAGRRRWRARAQLLLLLVVSRRRDFHLPTTNTDLSLSVATALFWHGRWQQQQQHSSRRRRWRGPLPCQQQPQPSRGTSQSKQRSRDNGWTGR
jgi:hypothetical protein